MKDRPFPRDLRTGRGDPRQRTAKVQIQEPHRSPLAADGRLIEQVKVVAGERDHHELLFRTAAQRVVAKMYGRSLGSPGASTQGVICAYLIRWSVGMNGRRAMRRLMRWAEPFSAAGRIFAGVPLFSSAIVGSVTAPIRQWVLVTSGSFALAVTDDRAIPQTRSKCARIVSDWGHVLLPRRRCAALDLAPVGAVVLFFGKMLWYARSVSARCVAFDPRAPGSSAHSSQPVGRH